MSEGPVLTFDELRAVNVARCEEVFHKLDRWNALEWAGAMCGEAGEAANLCKKLKRLDEADKVKDSVMERVRLLHEALIEVADVVIYADLLAAHLAQKLEALQAPAPSLGRVVQVKFNRVSMERDSRYYL